MAAPGDSDEPLYRLTQSAGLPLLGTALGCAFALLLAALRLPWAAGVVVLLAAAYGVAGLRLRAEVIATRRRLVVRRAWREEAVRFADVRAVRLERDLWSTDLVVARASGRPLRVRDLQDPSGAVAVLGSLVRAAREPRPIGVRLLDEERQTAGPQKR